MTYYSIWYYLMKTNVDADDEIDMFVTNSSELQWYLDSLKNNSVASELELQIIWSWS